MSKLLIDERPLVLLPKLATTIGLNEAIVLQQLHYWLNTSGGVEKFGHKWVYNTYEDWQKTNFPFWSVHTVRRIFTSLEDSGLIISSQLNKNTWDRMKSYRINYDALNKAPTKMPDDVTKLDSSEEAKLDSSKYTETNTETNPIEPARGLDWMIAAGVDSKEISEHYEKVDKDLVALNDFERNLKFNPLPWYTNVSWTKFARWVRSTYDDDNNCFSRFAKLRDEEGKFTKRMSNERIRLSPDAFMDTFRQYEGDKQEKVVIDVKEDGTRSHFYG